MSEKKDLTLPEQEKKILDFWQKNKIFKKSLNQTNQGRPFIFYEGPPTANGQPGLHHVLARSFKDAICRFQTMRGRFVKRQAGWDTHGLPVEIQVEKTLGTKSKKDIESLKNTREESIKFFNKKCKESVFIYRDLWEKLTNRMGFWLDMANPYITYDPQYIDTLWYIIKQIGNQKLLYQGHKVIPFCPRCGTGLSSHEIAQGYKTVTDNSLYLKFKLLPGQKIDKFRLPSNSYLSSWTTTPWTLPGNIALAVNSKLTYLLIQNQTEHLIIAEKLNRQDLYPGKVIKKIKGSDLVGLKYQPLFSIKELKDSNSFKVISADFVTATEGTGLVHTAVMYGEDDYQLGLKANLKQIHTVSDTGHFLDFLPKKLAGLNVKSKETEKIIIDSLNKNHNLIKVVAFKHEYPHCWRCDTPLIYYARSSWFIKMSALKTELIKNNSAVNWIPSHLKNGRFGEWIKDVKDWAISRERYWATPLPIWQCSACSHKEIISGIKELEKRTIKTTNRYFFIRHGEAISNIKKILSSYPEKLKNPLTPKGKTMVLATTKKLKPKNIDLIICSELERSRATGEIIKKELNLKTPLITEPGLNEVNFGALNGHPLSEYHSLKRDQSESLLEVRSRLLKTFKKIDRDYKNKNILIVSHEAPLLELINSLSKNSKPIKAIKNAEVISNIKPTSLPLNDEGELDLHRPFIDEVRLNCPYGHIMKRVPDVVDVWFDSGAMPFASQNYPANKKIDFPADYICEAVDQTRGWFYTLLAVSTLLKKGPAYKNVISLGHLNDRFGKKMSKSRGNIIDPEKTFDQYGADPVRWHFYTINAPGETKNFNEQDLKKVNQKVFNILKNSSLFLQTYKPLRLTKSKSSHPLDLWLNSRVNETIKETTTHLDNLDLYRAAISIEVLIDDLSRWYIRRSRPRFQNPESVKDHSKAAETLRQALLNISLLLAPLAPFFADYLYQTLKGPKESVHLASWPKAGTKNQKLNQAMATIRDWSSLTLAKRTELGLKVKQPLLSSTLYATPFKDKKLLSIYLDEVNVKKVIFKKPAKNKTIDLDTKITPELKNEYLLREIMRAIQSLRASAHLKPGQLITLSVSSSKEINNLINKNSSLLKKSTSLKDIKFTKPNSPKHSQVVTIESHSLNIYL